MSHPLADRCIHAPRRALAHLAAACLLGAGGAAHACDHGDHLDVVTLNAWGLPAPISPQRPRRMAALGRWLNTLDADVVGLQEVWTGAVPMLRGSVERATARGDDGLAFRALDHTPIEAMRFTRARGFDAWKRKGAIRARVPTAAGPVWVVDTHFQAGHGVANGQVRAAQLDQLLVWIDDLEGPVILLGDLNVDERHPEDVLTLERLDQAGFRDVATTLDRAEPTYPGNGRRYDRILVRDGPRIGFEAEQISVLSYDDDPDTPAPIQLSDHHPLRARLRLVARQ